MTYNVSSGTLNTTMLYRFLAERHKGDVNQALVLLCCVGLLCFYLVVVVVVTFVLLMIGYKDPFFCTSQATGWVDHL